MPDESSPAGSPTNNQPVAYDQDGRPLYAHPPTPQIVHMARPLEPSQPVITPELQAKHDQSRRDFPQLNLSEGEYVVSAITRHPIGLLSIWAISVVIISMILAAAVALMANPDILLDYGFPEQSGRAAIVVMLLISVLFFFGSVIATVVYNGNRFFLTNESVIQYIQISLFSMKEQTISLINIEDASYRQHGILQTLINYGSLRLSTEGDETTYRFNYVSNPRRQITLLNNAVEAFKNGRPILND